MFRRSGRTPAARAASSSPRVTRWAAAGAGLVVASAVVAQSSAAFTSTTSRPGNTWAAGTVIVTAANAGTAMFTETNLKPGSSGEQCVVVTYSGSLAAEVRLHAAVNTGTSPLSNGLEQYLNATVTRAAGDQSGNCATLTSPISVYSGTLQGLATTHSNFTNGATGTPTWAPTPPSTSMVMTYKIAWSLQDNNAAQGLRANTTFTWEAQNT